MQIKVVIVSALTVALLGIGMLAGSVFGASHAFAQTAAAPVAQTAAAPAAQAAAAPARQAAIAAPVGQTAAATPVPATPSAPAEAAEPAKPNAAQAKITQAQAEAAALAASPGSTVDHTQLSNQSGTLAYDVDFANGGGVLVDATTGAIIKTEAAGTDAGGRGGHGGFGADQAALAAKAKITQAQAEAAAVAVNAGVTVDHSSLGQDANGTIFWDVDFSNGGGAKVDATTGAVIASEAAGTDHVGGGRPGGHGSKGAAPATTTQP